MFSQATLLMAYAASASAHIVMTYPVPFNNATLNNSPLGVSDFPCKQRPNMYDVTVMNQWNAGETKQVSFMGSAVHGGGSCQFSITTDAAPTKDSQWKVIQSNIGGCPANAPGNLESGLPTDTSGPKFPVTMPKDIPDGQYTFSWSWINKVGNREFYMNCAPVQIGGGSGKASTASAAKAMSALPDMFVANLPDTDCSVAASQDFVYPNPGQNVVRGQGSTPGSSMTGAKCSTQNLMGAGNGQIGSPSAGTPSQPSSPSQPQVSSKPSASAPAYQAPAKSSAAAPVKSGSPGGVFAPGASSAPASSPIAQPAPPAAKPSAPVAQPVPSSKPETPNTTAPTNGECTPCTNDGAVVCIGSKQFGLCNRGCAVAQDLALGMACTNGVVVAATKRHLNFPRAHLHRRHSAARLL